MEKFAGNYSNDWRFATTEWLCRCEKAREEESHLASVRFSLLGDLKNRFGDLHHDEKLGQFFQEVLARRDEMDKKKETWDGGVNTILETILFLGRRSHSRVSIQWITLF